MTLRVLGGNGVPGAGVSAVLVNVTVVPGKSTGYVTLYEAGISRPLASTVNYRPTVVIANQATVRVGAGGAISIANQGGTAHVIVDVQGWIGTDNDPPGARVRAISPKRILDTRTSVGGRNGNDLDAGERMTLKVLGIGGIPADGVSAILANVTAVPSASTTGYLTVYPTGTPKPLASNVNPMRGVVTATSSLLQLGADGSVDIYNYAGRMHVVIDVQALVTGGAPGPGNGTHAVAPTRILDSRTALGGRNGTPLGANEVIKVPVLGHGGVPASGVAAVTVHVTAVAPTVPGYLTLFPYATRQPTSSTLNTTAPVVSNTAVVPVGPAGAIGIRHVGGKTHVVVDVQGWTAAPPLTVTPPSALLAPRVLAAGDAVRAQQVLANSNRYAMTTWWDTVAPGLLGTPLGPESAGPDMLHPAATGTDPIRRLSMQALSLSTAIATGGYDESVTGVPLATAKSRTITLIDKVAASHTANAGNGWGATWQSSLNSGIVGRAGWFLWPELGAELRADVARMVAFEADYSAGLKIHYMRDASGRIVDSGDTGSDDTSWWTMPMQLAVVMFPQHPHVRVWWHHLVQFSLAAWARPGDVNSTAVINGAPLSSWLNGSNVESNGVVVNHNRVAPDYSTLVYQNIDAIPLLAFSGVAVPRAIVALHAPVYAAYRDVTYAAPPHASPGGQVYAAASGDVYYPQGCDWGTGQKLPYALVDAQSAAYGFGTSESAGHEQRHADAHLAMQARFTDGRTYAYDSEYNYAGREEHTAQLASQLYLTKYLRDTNAVTYTDQSYWLAS
ncbi:MAG: hypothetical protein ACRDT4_16455 [Micromonosporaceae bacterium]